MHSSISSSQRKDVLFCGSYTSKMKNHLLHTNIFLGSISFTFGVFKGLIINYYTKSTWITVHFVLFSLEQKSRRYRAHSTFKNKIWKV